MKKVLFILVLFGSIAIIPVSVFGQEPVLKTYSLGVNAMHLYDLPVNFYDDALSGQDMQGLNGENTQFDFGFEVFAEKMFTPLFGLQLSYRNGGLTGANDVEYYENTFWEAGLDAKFTLSNLALNRIGNPWGFFVKPGLAYGQADAKRYLQQDDVLNNELEVSYWSVRLGTGVQYQFSRNFRAQLQVGYNTVLNDGFDGFNYAKGFDAYLNSSLGVAYTFGKKDDPVMGATNYFSEDYVGGLFAYGAAVPSSETVPVASGTTPARDSLMEQELEASRKKMNELERELMQQKEALRKMAESRASQSERASQSIASGKQITVYFDFDSDRLSEEAKRNLWEHSEVFRSGSFTLVGHADKTGPESYNESLKKRRAEKVKQFLIQTLKVPEENIEIEAGSTEEMADADEFLNRRVVVKF